MFVPLRRWARALDSATWPSVEALQRLVDICRPPIVTAGGAPLTFVPQGRRPRGTEVRYEARIYLHGEVQVRPESWHDLLNALVWLTFPRAKVALNARHYRELIDREAEGSGNRGPVQDALTLFDEGGVIVAAGEADLLRLVDGFAWKQLFWHQRERVANAMRFHLFGHALFEKALAPFSGITGRAILLEIGEDVLAMPLEVQIAVLDGMIAERLQDPARLRSTRELAPLPVLGVPGWCAENNCASYYDDTTCFRPGRR